MTSQTAFEVKLLDEITLQITFAGSTFESQAQVYNTMHGREDKRRLELLVKTFGKSSQYRGSCMEIERETFGRRLVSIPACTILQSVDCLSDTNLSTNASESNRRDIEELCEYANLHRSLHTPKWIAHCCRVKGCQEGFAVIDGNEKINRPVCAAPKSRVNVPHQHIFMTSMCTRSPITGGKHQRPSKFCSKHSYLESDGDSEDVNPSYPLPLPHTADSLLETSQVGDLPENDDPRLLTGCRKEKGVNRFHERTAGVLALYI